MLATYQVGKLVRPQFRNSELATAHAYCLTFLQALTEIENTLANNTSLFIDNPPAYLWREIFSVFC